MEFPRTAACSSKDLFHDQTSSMGDVIKSPLIRSSRYFWTKNSSHLSFLPNQQSVANDEVTLLNHLLRHITCSIMQTPTYLLDRNDSAYKHAFQFSH
jgi:hypothetical protein